ncbi:hypothetical protein EI94DRAFT_1731772 [Lactarius quietus]|nr:hypothetical protein EI94DRAFT_1731772 [Lactarius quietus]
MRTIHLTLTILLALIARDAAVSLFPPLNRCVENARSGNYGRQLLHIYLKGSASSDAKKFVKRAHPSLWEAKVQKIDPHDDSIR